MAPQSIPRSEAVYRHRTHWMDLLAEGSHYTARNLHCQSFTKPSSKGQGLLQGWQCTGENEIIKDFSRITRHWLWTDINSRRPQTSLWPTCQHRGLWRSDNRWRFSSVLSNSGCLYPSCGYFPSFGTYNWNRHTQQLAESPHYFLNVPNLADSTAPLWLIKLSSTTLLLRKQFLKDKWTLTYLKLQHYYNPVQYNFYNCKPS